MQDIVERLKSELPESAVVTGAAIAERATSYWDASPTEAKALLRPESTEQVSAIMRLCHESGQTVVMQGGLTGSVEGALATTDDVIVTLERMNAIEVVDELDGVATIQAGAIVQHVQEALADKGFLFPLDLGARGSCTIGGTVATNAGGINVLRYGMMRQLVLGLEAVLADGTVISSMNQMLKNNTGYDLKQLFIGSEGTLGIVTRVVVKLFPMPASRQTAMMATESFDSVGKLLKMMQADLAGTLSAFEVMWQKYFADQTGEKGHTAPMQRDYPYYVLVEAEGANPASDAERFQALLERGMEEGLIVDAVLPKSDLERNALWAIREEFEALQPSYLYDISLPMKSMPTYVDRLDVALADWRSDAIGYVFGHIADGNLHIFVRPYEDGRHHQRCDEIVYGCLEGLNGSVSAEHGIGSNKKAWLGSSRSETEIALMRNLKGLLDPKNLLNPNLIF